MSETSPTDQVDANTGSAPADLPDQTSTQPSADEQHTDSVSGGDTQDADQDDNSQQSNSSTTDDDSSSSDDDGLAKFAKSQGIEDLSDLSDRERTLLKTAHDNQKAFRTTKQKQTDELRDTITDVNTVDDSELEDLDPTEQRELERDSRMARLEAKERANEYFLRNADARDFESEMAQIIAEEAQANGKDAARYLASNLDRVLVLAKARRGVGEDQARADGAREERERLRKRQEGSADSGEAQQSNTSSKKITKEDIAKMPLDEYEKLRESGELEAAIQRGDLY